MLPGLDPKKMQAMMKQMGISQQEIDASRVIIEKNDNSKIIIENPSVVKVKMHGQESFQITGDIKENEDEDEIEEGISDEDIKTVMQKTKCTHDQAKKVLESTNGDLAEAIMELSE
jgi:nascent polypeptide-associated complex subunit alpha